MRSRKFVATLSVFTLLGSGLAASARAAIYTTSSPEEAMVYSGSPNGVWDPKGATEISGSGLNTEYPGNSEYALIDFNTASMQSQLNSTYGVNGWEITGVGLTLYSNFATANVYPNNPVFNEIEPGSFTFSWMSNNGWTGDKITWNTLNNYLPASSSANLLEAEGTFSFAANGTSPNSWTLTPTADLLNDIAGGGQVSFLGTPADNTVGYLFNTITQANPAVLDVTVQPVPEPGSCALLAVTLGLLCRAPRRRTTSTR
jgi:hypothetical protein